LCDVRRSSRHSEDSGGEDDGIARTAIVSLALVGDTWRFSRFCQQGVVVRECSGMIRWV